MYSVPMRLNSTGHAINDRPVDPMHCPNCSQPVRYGWRKYVANAFGRLKCPACGVGLQLKNTLVYSIVYGALNVLGISGLVMLTIYVVNISEPGEVTEGCVQAMLVFSFLLPGMVFSFFDKSVSPKLGRLVIKPE